MKYLTFFLILLVFFNFASLDAETVSIYNFKKKKIIVNGRELSVLVAQTQKEREIGLSNTELSMLKRLGVDGMLFIFNDSSEKTFQAWHMRYDLLLLVLEKKGENKYTVKERKTLRIGTIEKVIGKYVLEIPLRNSLIGGV